MGLATPVLTYSSIAVNGTEIALSANAKISFNSPYNRIDISFTPTNCSLSYYEARITAENAEYDIGVGNLAYWSSNVALNTLHSFSIAVNSTNFSAGDGTYRISLYAKSAIDGSWDVSYLFFTVDGDQFMVQDVSGNRTGFGVLTTVDAPVHE